MKYVILACTTTAFLAAPPAPAGAQTTIDVAKITCEQWLLHKVADYDHIAIWLSGYLSGKRGNTTVDVQSSKDAVGRMKQACFKSLKVPLMQVMDQELQTAR